MRRGGFQQAQTPQGLYLTQWAAVDVSTILRGSVAPTVAPDAGAFDVSNASFHYDGDDYAVDLTTPATYAAIAAVIQTAIAANLTGATFTYTDNVFVLTRPDAAAGDAAFTPHTAGTGTDASAALRLDADSNPVHLQGHDAETPSQAVAEIDRTVAHAPVNVMRTSDTADTYGATSIDTDADLRSFSEASVHMYFQDEDYGGGAIPGTTPKTEAAFDLQQRHTVASITVAETRPGVGAAARLSAVDYDGFGTQITLFGKTLSGVLPTDISDSAYAELIAIRGNIYTNVDGQPSFVEGMTGHSDYFADESYGLLWLANELTAAQWQGARQSRRLTRAGLLRRLNSVFTQAVNNGILQRGLTVRPETAADIRRTTGNTAFGTGEGGAPLVHGFLVYVGQVVSREAPGRRGWQARRRSTRPRAT